MPNPPQFPDLANTQTDLPFPLRFAKKWNFSLRYVKTEDGYFFAIHDWIRGLTGKGDERKTWHYIKQRDNFSQISDSIRRLPYALANGKIYQMDFTDDNGLYVIVQHLHNSNTPAVHEIESFLVQAGIFVDKSRLDPEKTVFISYRRDVSSGDARSVFMDLRAHGYDVFMDVESIDNGTFDTIILNQIAARAHFLVILTPGTVERCVQQRDWLRQEIEHAMDLQRNIVPLIFYGFQFKGTEACLTGKLSQLSRYNALSVPHDYFEAAMDKLRTRFLKQSVYGTLTQTPPTERAIVEQKIAKVVSQPPPTEKQLTAEDYVNRSDAHYKQGNLDAAMDDASEAIRLNPQFATAYNNRGVVRYDKGEVDGAIADYNEALRLDPQHALAYNNRGWAHHNKGNLDEALADYNEAIRLNPTIIEAYVNRSWARYNKGNLDGAITDASEALRLDPQHAMAYNNRGLARYSKEDLDGAIADYTRSIELKNPELHLPYSNRGLARYKKGDLNRAITDFIEAIHLNQQYPMSYGGLGDCFYHLKRYSEALDEYERYLQLAGSNPNKLAVERVKELKQQLGR